MSMNLNNTLLLQNMNKQFSNMKNVEVEICEFNLFYIKEIVLKICNNQNPIFIHFNRVSYFKGNLNCWKSCDLKIYHKNEPRIDILRSETNRDICSDVFILKDTINGFFIKSEAFSVSESLEVRENNLTNSNYYSLDTSTILERTNYLLKKWNILIVRLWNSTSNPLIVRVEPIKKEESNIHFILYNPIFLCGYLQNKLTNLCLKYEDNKFKLMDVDRNFYIECVGVEIEENVEPIF